MLCSCWLPSDLETIIFWAGFGSDLLFCLESVAFCVMKKHQAAAVLVLAQMMAECSKPVQGLGATTIYCGDGINDIAALAAADVGMAIGATDAVVAASLSTSRKSVAGKTAQPVCCPASLFVDLEIRQLSGQCGRASSNPACHHPSPANTRSTSSYVVPDLLSMWSRYHFCTKIAYMVIYWYNAMVAVGDVVQPLTGPITFGLGAVLDHVWSKQWYRSSQ